MRLVRAFKIGRDKRWVHALGFKSINEEQLEIFHEVVLYNKKGGLKNRS
jgi:hypothetical protein